MFLEKSSPDNSPWTQFTKANGDLVPSLKTLLGDIVTFYFRAHGFHWNVKGTDFSQYHELFESIYEDTYGSIDPTAENILKLGSDSPFRLIDFMGNRTIAESGMTPDDPRSMAQDLLQGNEQLIVSLQRAFDSAMSSNEQGVANFLAERLDMHKKWSWQLKASLGLS